MPFQVLTLRCDKVVGCAVSSKWWGFRPQDLQVGSQNFTMWVMTYSMHFESRYMKTTIYFAAQISPHHMGILEKGLTFTTK